MLANYNPCDKQDESFTKKCLVSLGTLIHCFLFKCWIWHANGHCKSPTFVSYLQL